MAQDLTNNSSGSFNLTTLNVAILSAVQSLTGLNQHT